MTKPNRNVGLEKIFLTNIIRFYYIKMFREEIDEQANAL
jgi:hypothetical protein